MTNYTKFSLQFSNVKNKKVVGNFKGGEVTSDGGILLLSKIDKRINLTKSIAKYFVDNRRSSHIVHSIQNMLKQRIYALAAGYEDLNDHDLLKKDSAFKTAVGKEINLASSPTLCRFENSMTRSTGVHIHQELLRIFVESFSQPPEKVILDFDATDMETRKAKPSMDIIIMIVFCPCMCSVEIICLFPILGKATKMLLSMPGLF